MLQKENKPRHIGRLRSIRGSCTLWLLPQTFHGLGSNLCGLLLWSPANPDSLIANPDLASPSPSVRPGLPLCLLLPCLELSMRKWWTEWNSGIKNKEWAAAAAAAAGFGVTGEVGRSSCELEFQRPAPAEVVGSAHTFHISQSSLGWQLERGSVYLFCYRKPSFKGL